MSYTIKAAQQQDIDEIVHILEEYYSEEDADYFRTNIEQTISKSGLDKTEHYVVVKDDDKKIQAFLGYRDCHKDFLEYTFSEKPIEISAIYVHKDHMKQGAGRMLVSFLSQKALEKRYTEVLVRSSDEFKNTGWPFYEKMGFELVGMHTDDQDDTAAIFRLKL